MKKDIEFITYFVIYLPWYWLFALDINVFKLPFKRLTSRLLN